MALISRNSVEETLVWTIGGNLRFGRGEGCRTFLRIGYCEFPDG